MSKEIALKFRRHKRALFLKRLFLIVAFFITASIGLFFGAYKVLTIENIEVAGAERLSGEDIADYAKKKQGPLFLNLAELAEALKAQFSIINNAEISRNFWKRTLEIQVEERENWAVWCGSDPINIEKEKCFYIDEGGVIFKESPQFSGRLFLKIKDRRAYEFKEGGRVIDEEFFKNLKNFLGHLEKNSKISVKSIEISDRAEFWLYSDFKMIIDAETDFERALENIALFLDSAEKEKIGQIEYIDLRFKDKIFYK